MTRRAQGDHQAVPMCLHHPACSCAGQEGCDQDGTRSAQRRRRPRAVERRPASTPPWSPASTPWQRSARRREPPPWLPQICPQRVLVTVGRCRRQMCHSDQVCHSRGRRWGRVCRAAVPNSCAGQLCPTAVPHSWGELCPTAVRTAAAHSGGAQSRRAARHSCVVPVLRSEGCFPVPGTLSRKPGHPRRLAGLSSLGACRIPFES